VVERTLPLGSPGNKIRWRNAGRREFSQSIQAVAAKLTNVALSLFVFYLVFFVLPWFVISPNFISSAKKLGTAGS
jgi:hypothetical protein